jgi:hypothetical protein
MKNILFTILFFTLHCLSAQESTTTDQTSSLIRKSYFIRATGAPGYLNLSNNSIAFGPKPSAIEFHSNNGGKTALISLGNYWFKVDTSGPIALINLETTKPSYSDKTALFSIETVTSLAIYGVTYGIKCKLNGKNYYLNNANYSSLNFQQAESLKWPTNGAGLFWEFYVASPTFEQNQLLHQGSITYDTASPFQYNLISNPDSVLSYQNSGFAIEKESNINNYLSWNLDTIPEGIKFSQSFEIIITNEKNEKNYLTTKSGVGAGCDGNGLKLNNTPMYFPNIQSGWLECVIPTSNAPTYLALINQNIPDAQKTKYNVTLGFCEKGGGFACSTTEPIYPNNVTASLFSLKSSTKQYIPTKSTSLQATKKANLPPIIGHITQELSYRSIGSNKYYFYGGEDTIYVARRNHFFPTLNTKDKYAWNGTQAIFGSSLHKSYFYLINNDSLRLYSLFGIDNSIQGLVSKTYIGPIKGTLRMSAPVYNPISHSVYGIYNTGVVYGYSQGLNAPINPVSTLKPKPIPDSKLELFVIPNNDTITYLYHLNNNNQLLKFIAYTKSIQPVGSPIPVFEREIRWLRHQTKMLNHEPTVPEQTLVPIRNGYAASGSIGSDSTYVLFFVQDSILGATNISLYKGPTAAFPSFPDHSTISEVSYGKTISMTNWVLQSSKGNNLWTEGSPLMFYDSKSRTFSVETLAKSSPLDDTSKVYTFTIPLSVTTSVAGLFNLEWQNAAGKVSNIQEGTPLHLWYQYNWMKSANPFED